MKVLLCCPHFQRIENGPAKFARLMFEKAKEGEIELHILTEDATPQFVATFNDDKLHTISISTPFRMNSLMLYPARMRYYKKGINALQQNGLTFDRVVFNNVMVGNLFYKEAKQLSYGMINDDNKLRLSKWSSWHPQFVAQKILRFIERVSAENVGTLIVNSQFIAKKVMDEYGISKDKIAILYKGIDFSNIIYSEYKKMPTQVCHVLFVKSDYKRGGLLSVIEALGRLRQRNFKLTVIGPNPNTVEKELHSSGSRPENVDFNLLGPQEQHTVFEYMRNAHIFCVPSKFEALGVANMEAMAHGLPVVTTQNGGIPEVTDNGKLCWIVETENSDTIKDAIEAILAHPEVAEAKTKAARNYVLQKFNADFLYRNFLDVIEAHPKNRQLIDSLT